MKLLSKPEYLDYLDETRDSRMNWWREARFGMFVHYGLYSVLQRHEWAMAIENVPVDEYEKLADRFLPNPGAPKEWAKLAKEAGMKYMVLTSRHHEGFSLWDSKVNPYNSVNYGPRRDIVKEFVDACREYGLKFGFYTSLMDWHHPDGGRCAYDSEARKRFTDYVFELNKELLTQYGKIDILWFDVAAPMETPEGWNSLEMNQRLREIQPHLVINNRSLLAEDFGTPEEDITPSETDWEACMTFNGLSWGYIDSEQAKHYSYNAQQIIRMLNRVTAGGGNLLLNIGPKADGSVPVEAFEPLRTVGKWLSENGEAVYGKFSRQHFGASGLCSVSVKENNAYIWNWIWNNELVFGGFETKLKNASFLNNGQNIGFTQEPHRIILKGLPDASPDPHAGIAVIKLEFEEAPCHITNKRVPALHRGREYK